MRLADLTLDVQGEIVHVQLSGEIDLSNARALRAQIARLTPNDARGAVLDLGEVGYLDSEGIHLIHRLRNELRARGQKLVLVIPPESPIRDALRLAGLDWGSETAPTLSEADQLVE